MGLGENSGRLTYLNVKKGKIAYKNKDGEQMQSDFVEGFITKVEIVTEEYQGQSYEKAKIMIIDGEDKFQLQLNVDSGYFRSFCNAFKSGNPQLRTKFTPNYSEKDGKKISGCFIDQNGSSLKWFYSKANENLDELPKVKKVKFKGKDQYDGTEQLDFWKKWLLGLKFKEEIEAVSKSQPQENGLNENKKEVKKDNVTANNSSSEDDDLPF